MSDLHEARENCFRGGTITQGGTRVANETADNVPTTSRKVQLRNPNQGGRPAGDHAA
jgi:hypothetical protein